MVVAIWLLGAMDGQAQRFVKYVETVAALKELNVADVHRAVHVDGYFARGDGGGGVFYWDASASTATNYGTVFKGKTTGSEMATGRWVRTYRQSGPMELAWFGMSNAAGDYPRLVDALGLTAQLTVSVAATVATNLTVAAGDRIRFDNGGSFAIAGGVTLTINGEIEAGSHAIFLGAGAVVFTVNSPNGFVNVRWFGALDSVTRSDDNVTPFNRAIASVPTSSVLRGMYLFVPGGNYWFASGLTIPSSLDLRGEGMETTLLRSNFSATGTLLAIPGNVEARIWNLQLLNDPAAVCTNTGISIGNMGANLAKLEMQNVSIKQWTANGLAMTNVAYLRAQNCLWQNNQNSASFNGTGTTVARALFLGGSAALGSGDGYVNAASFAACRFQGNDQVAYLPAVVGLSFLHCTMEDNGARIGLSAPSTLDIGAGNFFGFLLWGGYCEANYAGPDEAVIKLGNGRSATISSVFANSRASIQRNYNSVFVNGEAKGVVVTGSSFDGALQCFITNRAAAPVTANVGNTFAPATVGTNQINYLTNATQLGPMLGGLVIYETEGDGWTGVKLDRAALASFANANHTHQNSAGGGTLDAAAIGSGVFNIARLATGTPDGTKFVADDSTLKTAAPLVHTHAASDTTTGTFAADRIPWSAATNTAPMMLSDMTTALTTGTNRAALPLKNGATIKAVRAYLLGAMSSSGAVEVDITENGTSILSTLLTIDANEADSTTAAAAVISDAAIAAGAVLRAHITGAGTGAAGLQVQVDFTAP